MNLPKPKRGYCGTCHWFEANPTEMQTQNQPRIGLCFVNPPQAAPSMGQVRGSQFTAGGPQMAPTSVGLTPPTSELRRCSEWRPMGTLPPFDDTIRPGYKHEESVDEIKQ
jgi:hypothetical protein